MSVTDCVVFSVSMSNNHSVYLIHLGYQTSLISLNTNQGLPNPVNELFVFFMVVSLGIC